MNQSIKGLALFTFLSLVVLSGCSEQPFGPDDMGGNVAASALNSATSVTSRGQASTGVATPTTVRLLANLLATSSDPKASGRFEFVSHVESRTGPARRLFRTEVDNVSADGIGLVVVTRGGQTVYEHKIIIINGSGAFKLDTANGDQVPPLQTGDQVTIYNPDGKPILEGTLQAN